jgi:hypothetical protein
MDTLPSAFALTYRSGGMAVLSVVSAGAMFLLMAWSGELLHHYPTGWEYDADLSQTLAVLILSLLFGLLAALELAVMRKARGAASAASGMFGGLTGLLSMTCCAPFIVPSLLSALGFSGTSLLSFNGAMHRIATPLLLLSIALLVCALVLASRSLVAVCRVGSTDST